MQPNNESNNPASLIPAAHLPQVANALATSGSNNQQVLSMLRQIQEQINAISGQVSAGDQMPDVVMVNPVGRIVEVNGKQAVEYLAKPGYRKANEQEEINYRKAILRQTPEFLKRLEAKRISDEKKFMDQLEAEDALNDPTTLEQLLSTNVTDAQKTGALEPEQVAKVNTPQSPTSIDTTTSVVNEATRSTGSDQTQNETPPKRGAKATSTNTTTSNTNTDTTKQTPKS